MAGFNDFLNTKTDPIKSDLTKNITSNLQQTETPFDDSKVSAPEFKQLKEDIEPKQASVPENKEKTPFGVDEQLYKGTSVSSSQSNVKEIKLEDINKELPDYSDIEAQNYSTNAEYQAAQAKEEYAAHVRQVQKDASLYSTPKGGTYSSKMDDTYSMAFLENEKKPNSFDWSKYAMLSRMSKPIYQYGKESFLLSATKGLVGFGTNLLSSTARVISLPYDVATGQRRYERISGDDGKAALHRSIEGISKNEISFSRELGEQLTFTTKSFKDINQALDISLGINVTKDTNMMGYTIGQALGNVAAQFGTMGLSKFATSIQAVNAIRNVAGNLTVGMYASAAFQSYALDGLNAGADPLKVHAGAFLNAIINGVVERMQWKFIENRIGAGSYTSASKIFNAYKELGPKAFYSQISKDFIAASMLSEGFEEGIQQTVEHGLKLVQGIEEQDAVGIIADIGQSLLLGALLSLPFAGQLAQTQAQTRRHIAAKFANLNEDDANAIASIFMVYGEQVAKDKDFQKDFVLFLRDQILNLKPADKGQDTNPTTDSGIVQELSGDAKLTQGTDNFDTMIKNGNNLKESLFDLMFDETKKAELDKVMMDVSKMVKNYATKYMGQSEEEANLTAQSIQNSVLAISILTDMSAKQIFNAIMPKIHNRSMVMALNNYQSANKGGKTIFTKYRYKNNQSLDKLQASANAIKQSLDQNTTLSEISRMNAEGRTLEISDYEKNMAESKAIVQREAAIQQQIRKRNGKPISYNEAIDIAIYKLLGANENIIASVIGPELSFNNEKEHNSKRVRYILSALDTTNDDFLGIQTYESALAADIQNREGTDAAARNLLQREANNQVAMIYADRVRNIVDSLKKDKNYEISKEDSAIVSQAIQLADKQEAGNDIYGFNVTSSQTAPIIFLSKLATRDVTAHEFAHQMLKMVVSLNSYMAKHTGYHFVYFNNIINGIDHILLAQGKNVKLIDKNGNINEEAAELYANVIEDYITGKLKIDDPNITDLDRRTLDSVLDSYNNSVSSSNVSYEQASDIKTQEAKKTADELAAETLVKKTALSSMNLSGQLVNQIQSILTNEKISSGDMLAQLKAIYEVALKSNLLTHKAEIAMQLYYIESKVNGKFNINKLLADSKSDLLIVATNLYTDIAKNSINNIITTEGPQTKPVAGTFNSKGKSKYLQMREDIRNRANQIISETVNKNNNRLLKEDKNITNVSELSKQLFGVVNNSNKKAVTKLKNYLYNEIKKDDAAKKALLKYSRATVKEALSKEKAYNYLEDGNITQEEYDKQINEIENKHFKEAYDFHKQLSKLVNKKVSEIKMFADSKDSYYIAKELTLQLQKDFVEKNKEQFTDEWYEEEEPLLADIERVAKDMKKAEEDYGKDTEVISLAELYDLQEYASDEDVLNATLDNFLKLKEGKEKEQKKDDTSINLKRSQKENYAFAKKKLENMKDSKTGLKGSELMTETELEIESQDAVNEAYTKNDRNLISTADIGTTLSARLLRKGLSYERKLSNFLGIKLLQKAAKGYEFVKDLIIPISERLKAAGINSMKNPLSGLRMAIFTGYQAGNVYTNASNELLEKLQPFSKNNPDKFMDFYAALLTDSKASRDVALKIAQEEGFEEELNKVLQLLNECKQLRIKWKEFRKGLTYYFPRCLNDSKGLMVELLKDKNSKIGRALIREYGSFDKASEALAIMDEDTAMNLYSDIMSKEFKNSKHRVIEVMQPKYLKYYRNIGDTLNDYFRDQVDLIIRDNFLGKVPMTIKNLERLHEEYKKNPLNTAGGWYNVLKELGYLDMTHNYNNKNNKVIAKVIDGVFFRARSSKSVTVYRDVASMMIISNPIAALENFKDIGNIAAQFGMTETLKSYKQVSKDMKESIANKDKAIEEATLIEELTRNTIKGEFREITQTGLAKWSEKARAYSGYQFLDSLNKLAYIKTTLNSYKKKLTSGNEKEYQSVVDEVYTAFNGNEQAANDCISLLKEDADKIKNSDEVKYFLWYKMCDNYALSAAEMPHWYNISTYGRLFYIFKMQPLKIASRNISEFKKKFADAQTFEEKKQVYTDLLKTLMFYAVCGIPVDYLKDILDGVPTDTLPDYAVYSITSYFLLSEYTLDSIMEYGPIKGLEVGLLLPPQGFDRIFTGQAIRSFPVVGRPFQGLFIND